MKRLAALVCASMLVSLSAVADPHTADDWYKQGENEYNLGNFEKAADAFKQGYALETNEAKKPVYLYNVAQAYRQANKCKDAEFFYKRFLSLKDADTAKPLKPTTRAEIEQWITQLEDCVKQQEAIAKRPPDGVGHPDGGDSVKSGSGTTPAGGTGTGSGSRVATPDHGGGEVDDGAGVTKHVTGAPQVLSARLVGGITKISAGTVTVPIQPTVTLVAGYPLHVIPNVELDVGGLLGFTSIPFENSVTGGKSRGSLTTVMADAGAIYPVAPKISVRGDLGVGVMMFGGISAMGNPFTEGGAPTSGALAMFAVRVSAAGEYELTPNLVATVMPAFSYSPPKAGLRDDIKSILHFDFMLGVGYRM